MLYVIRLIVVNNFHLLLSCRCCRRRHPCPPSTAAALVETSANAFSLIPPAAGTRHLGFRVHFQDGSTRMVSNKADVFNRSPAMLLAVAPWKQETGEQGSSFSGQFVRLNTAHDHVPRDRGFKILSLLTSSLQLSPSSVPITSMNDVKSGTSST